MARKLTLSELQMATAWFRENRLPLLKATGKNVRFHVEDDVDDEGKVHFVTTTSEAVTGIDS